MWFKDALSYQLTRENAINLSELDNQLKECEYVPCNSTEQRSFGWVSAIPDTKNLSHRVNNETVISLRACRETRDIPADTINEKLKEKVAAIELEQDLVVGKRQKDQIREDIIFELLPKAFSKYKFISLYIDLLNQVIVVNASSQSDAEDTLALLRKSIGSLPVVPYFESKSVGDKLNTWVVDGDTSPEELIIGESTKLIGAEGKITLENEDIYDEHIRHLIRNEGRDVDYLAMSYRMDFDFILTAKGQLKKLKFADQLKQQNDDIDSEDFLACFDADLVLMTGVLGRFFSYCKEQKLVTQIEGK